MNMRPISAYTKLGGLYFLARTLDKIRKHARGELHADHHEFLGKGYDGAGSMKDHPLGYGMPRDAAAFFARSPAFEIGRPRTDFEDDIAKDPAPPPGVRVVAQYPNGPLLLSGWTNGERHLHGRAAIVEAAIGKGRVVLLGFRTQHRGQAHGTFKLLFNAIYLAGSEPAQATWGSGAAR